MIGYNVLANNVYATLCRLSRCGVAQVLLYGRQIAHYLFLNVKLFQTLDILSLLQTVSFLAFHHCSARVKKRIPEASRNRTRYDYSNSINGFSPKMM